MAFRGELVEVSARWVGSVALVTFWNRTGHPVAFDVFGPTTGDVRVTLPGNHEHVATFTAPDGLIVNAGERILYEGHTEGVADG